MKFKLALFPGHLVVPSEVIEIFQPLLGYRSIAVWLNLYHALHIFGSASEADLIQQMNITRKDFRDALAELAQWLLVSSENNGTWQVERPPAARDLLGDIPGISTEEADRLRAQARAFFQRRGIVCLEPKIQEDLPAAISEQQADELTTRFIKECGFSPSKQLRERFDLWFDQIGDIRLLEELLSRTKRKIEAEGKKSGCPSAYADHIVRQWLVQGIATFEDLARNDREFQNRRDCYRAVEKELGRNFNTLTPSEKEFIDKWFERLGSAEAVGKAVAAVILSGEWQGKGLPGIAFLNRSLMGVHTKTESSAASSKKKFAHQHNTDDLQQAIRRKTKLGVEGSRDEG